MYSVKFKSAESSWWVLEELRRRGTIIDMFPHKVAMGCSSKRTKTSDPICRSEANSCQPAVGKRCRWMLWFYTWNKCPTTLLAFNGPSAIPPNFLQVLLTKTKRIWYPNHRSFQCGAEQKDCFISFTCNIPVYCPTLLSFFHHCTSWSNYMQHVICKVAV